MISPVQGDLWAQLIHMDQFSRLREERFFQLDLSDRGLVNKISRLSDLRLPQTRREPGIYGQPH